MSKQVELDDAQVKSMLANPKMLKLFPFLATEQLKSTQPCNTCKGRRAQARGRTVDYDSIRTKIVNQGHDKLRQLKTLLGASQVVVKARRGNGQMGRIRF